MGKEIWYKKKETPLCTQGHKPVNFVWNSKTNLVYSEAAYLALKLRTETSDFSPPAISCIPVQAPSHGIVNCSNGSLEGSKCSLVCQPGYHTTGPNLATCLHSAQWDAQFQPCDGLYVNIVIELRILVKKKVRT